MTELIVYVGPITFQMQNAFRISSKYVPLAKFANSINAIATENGETMKFPLLTRAYCYKTKVIPCKNWFDISNEHLPPKILS